jgi:hypothetical protein
VVADALPAQVQLVRLSQRASTTSVNVVRIAVRSAILPIAPFSQVRTRVPGPAGVEEAGDLVEDEAEPLRRLDDDDQADGVGWVEPVRAGRAVWFGERATAFVVARGECGGRYRPGIGTG